MRLPIDTGELRFVVMTPPRPVRVYGSSDVKTDRDGRQVYVVDVGAASSEDADVLPVKLPGPVEAQQFEPVGLRGLTAEYWEMNERSGISFRAEAMDRPTHTGGKPAVAAAATAARKE